ncbi:FitA-like ribbon-helix-helix domain-containing protein [Salinarimonas ramus]|uniref:Plasmid stabilization protein n=1 Tax=Salinarimonas ramus TaxID=690164 RepID=A0A917QAB8_9HYPH|nr:hypothetical protein [Salinarimonas ramus]GGK36050.1 plasmid stabilization protein [Salinarimonas ramus]
MTTLTVHDIPDDETRALAARAERNGRSLEEEVREILRAAVRAEPFDRQDGLAAVNRRPFAPYGSVETSATPSTDEKGFATDVRELFAPIGGVDLPELPRGPARELPSFE